MESFQPPTLPPAQPAGEVLPAFVPPVRELFWRAARGRSTLRFGRLLSLFPRPLPPIHDVWATLDAAAIQLAAPEVAIYGAVLSRSEDQLPGDGFFDTLRLHRRDLYRSIAGSAPIPGLTTVQRRQMAEAERLVVYAHAAQAEPLPGDA